MQRPSSVRFLLACSILAGCSPAESRPAVDTTIPAMTPAPSAPAINQPAAVPEQADKWSERSEKNEMDDSQQVFLTTSIYNYTGEHYEGMHHPVLVIRCMKNETDVGVVDMEPGRNAYEDDSFNSIRVRYRLDDEVPVAGHWTETVGNDGMFHPNAIGFAKKLLHHYVLKVEYTTIYGNPAIMEFLLAGLDKHLPAVAKTCGWSA